MRAILIDPEKRTLTEIDFKPGDDSTDAINGLLGSECFTTGSRALRGSMSDGFDTLYVSDDYLEDSDDPRFWFQVDVDRNPPSSHPIAGRGLVVGVDDQGKGCDARISVEELTRRITFTQRKFRGFKTFTGEEARARGAHVAIEVEAPIIDGTKEK
jgi:hypothetical protein